MHKVENGYYVDSDDLSELNLFLDSLEKVYSAVPEAIKYPYKHKDVRVLIEVPFPTDNVAGTENVVGLERLDIAAQMIYRTNDDGERVSSATGITWPRVCRNQDVRRCTSYYYEDAFRETVHLSGNAWFGR